MNAKQSFENILLVLLIVSSFLPDPPNRLVVGLSALAQSAAFFGVVLAPEGLLWLLMDFRDRTKGVGTHRRVLGSQPRRLWGCFAIMYGRVSAVWRRDRVLS